MAKKAILEGGKRDEIIYAAMQLFFEKGYEVQECDGLGLFKGNVVLMQDTSVKIPHMGWNLLKQNKQDCIYDTLQKQPYVYYVHSYYANNFTNYEVVYGSNLHIQVKHNLPDVCPTEKDIQQT